MSMLRVEGATLHYRVDGPDGAPVVVFSNSLGCDLRMWDAQAAVLTDRFRVVRYDTRGHGQSSPSDVPVTLPRLGEDVLALLDHLDVARAHLCGLSLGGVTALWLSAYHAERFDHAVFANTGAKIGTNEMWDARIEAVRSGGMDAVRGAALERFLSAPFRARSPEAAALVAGMIQETPAAAYVACCEALRDTDLRGVIASIRLPSLIIASELDVSTPPSLSHELHKAIAGSSLVVIPQTAHLSSVESPGAFNAALTAFLPSTLR
ncbi:MAG: 3-oxoadipate enol-lactonase [Gemmatimonadaceae bacterium]